ncbi:Hypothetical predicted protein [Pelobates cultripes]|uniref:Uncharacterized protein n=1 Tax=Pelobates cultripes TaxID=61616 RepID=A0AAD1RGE5_PELCU|nr:Hypothetical predicted protein [Pelobates cultripes]
MDQEATDSRSMNTGHVNIQEQSVDWVGTMTVHFLQEMPTGQDEPDFARKTGLRNTYMTVGIEHNGAWSAEYASALYHFPVQTTPHAPPAPLNSQEEEKKQA